MPKNQLIGNLNEGWRIAMTTLTHERGRGEIHVVDIAPSIAIKWGLMIRRAGIKYARGAIVRHPVIRSGRRMIASGDPCLRYGQIADIAETQRDLRLDGALEEHLAGLDCPEQPTYSTSLRDSPE
ncbi:MAG: hypothetical protein ETSY2_09095 [Candidatus Entotheonella gemina]|uniref:Uncharacterized protein n=1 Tax=Candidatus Entotheonella gemina TaxID=1429439 RepID=W4MC80_9BACT|nr:MAG: hypothetical protein ETSY2_09095 [Candidatus Entotheonella gemina]